MRPKVIHTTDLSWLPIFAMLVFTAVAVLSCTSDGLTPEQHWCAAGKRTQDAVERCSKIRACVIELYEVERMYRYLSHCPKEGVE